MLTFFRKAYLSQYLVLLFLTVIFWIPSFFQDTNFESDDSIGFSLLLLLTGNNSYVLTSLALAATILLGLFINNIAGEFDISSKLSTTTMFVFLLFASSLTPFTNLSSFLIVNIFLLFFINSLFKIPSTENSIPLVLNASLILGLSSLFFLPAVFLLLLIWAALILHRSNVWRNYLVSIIGVVLPHIFVLTWYFWSDITDQYFLMWTDTIRLNTNLFRFEFSLDLIISLIFLILYIFSLTGTMTRLTEKNINLRRNLIITQYFFIFTFIVVLLFAEGFPTILIIAIPGTFVLTHLLQGIKREKIFNITFFMLIIMILINQYFDLINSLFLQAG